MCNNNGMLVHALIFLTQAYSIHRINWWLSHKRLAHDRCQLVKYFFSSKCNCQLLVNYQCTLCTYYLRYPKTLESEKKHYREWFLTLILTSKNSAHFNYTILSETQYDWRKIEPVTMKANFIHFWCVESEFIVTNEFHNWTSKLGCIWHIFGKLGYFWLFSSTSALVATSF